MNDVMKNGVVWLNIFRLIEQKVGPRQSFQTSRRLLYLRYNLFALA